MLTQIPMSAGRARTCTALRMALENSSGQVIRAAEAVDLQGALQRRRAGRQLGARARSASPNSHSGFSGRSVGPPRGEVRAQALRDGRRDLLHRPQRGRLRGVGGVQALRRIISSVLAMNCASPKGYQGFSRWAGPEAGQCFAEQLSVFGGKTIMLQ